MKFASLYPAFGPPLISMELFPPKTPEGEQSLMRHVEALLEFQPRYLTCTYGAGGSTRDKTLAIVSEVKRRFHIPVASHLTCVGSTKEELAVYLRRAQDAQVDFIVALRGDPPQGATEFVPVQDGLRFANELVTLVTRSFPDFGIAVAGYPEVHREALSEEDDLRNLKRKVDAGGEIVITQLFYRNEDYFRFCTRCRAMGIQVPIIPGILPVTSLSQIQRIASLCAAQLPQAFIQRLSERDDADWQMQVGIEQATEQVQELVDHGVPGLHFYVLNKADATSRVLQNVRGLG